MLAAAKTKYVAPANAPYTEVAGTLCARATEMLVDMMNTETNVNSTYTKVATESASELPTIESAKSAVTMIGKNAR